MKSFILTVPKSLSQIENHYFCKCGNRFVNKAKCLSCGNKQFFTYEDVKNYNLKLYEIQNTKHGAEIFIEYPIVVYTEIKTKKERISILINNEIKLNKVFRENFLLYYDEISEVVKMYLKYLGLWKERRRYFYILKKYEDKRILYLTEAKDAEVLLWQSWNLNYTREEFFEKLLKNSPKSVKKAIYEKYKKQVFKFMYEPYVDYLILNAVDDVNLQRELIKSFEDEDVFIRYDLDALIKVLKQFDKKEVVKFLKKHINNIDIFARYASLNEITDFRKSIEETISMSKFKNKTYEYDMEPIHEYENLIFKLPKDYYELIDWGDKLRNCLDSYLKIHNKRYLIFGIFKGEKLTYAVKFDKEKKYIVEAKGFANSDVCNVDMDKIEKFFELNF